MANAYPEGGRWNSRAIIPAGLASGQAALNYYYPTTKHILEGIKDDFPLAKRRKTMPYYGRGKGPGKRYFKKKRTYRKKRTSRASYSTRAKTSSKKRYASRKTIGVGFPPRMTGVLKMAAWFNNITSSAATYRIGQMNLVDMNNDQRVPSTVTVEGTSHWMNGTAGATLDQYPTPYFFDTLKTLYTEYYITKIKTIIKFMSQDTTNTDDMTIAMKTFKPHDDEAETVRNSTDAELIRSQDRIKTIILRPLAAGMGGKQVKTVVLNWIVKNWIPARVWFNEQSDVQVGEKIFTSTTAIDSGNASHTPRCIFWAWKTRNGALIDDNAISVTQTTYYTYTAFGRKLPAVS